MFMENNNIIVNQDLLIFFSSSSLDLTLDMFGTIRLPFLPLGMLNLQPF
jgi:hypothetical protein